MVLMGSWILCVSAGHMAEFFQTESGYVDLKWQKEFGGIVRMKGPFGVSDTKHCKAAANR
jgi:hypothetical protein